MAGTTKKVSRAALLNQLRYEHNQLLADHDALVTLFNAAVTQLNSLSDDVVSIATKLNADAAVTATDYPVSHPGDAADCDAAASCPVAEL